MPRLLHTVGPTSEVPIAGDRANVCQKQVEDPVSGRTYAKQLFTRRTTMSEATLMNPDGTCTQCGHMATEHANGCSQCECDLVAEAAKEPPTTDGIGNENDLAFGLKLRKP